MAPLSQSGGPPQAPRTDQQPIRVGVDLVTVDAIVRDRKGRFVPNLGKADFELFEDGVKQDIISFTMSVGGRVINIAGPPAPQAEPGVVLPPSRPPADVSGRVFVIFIDDAHLDPRGTPQLTSLLKKISDELIHDGDLFGIATTGVPSVAVDLTYDRKRLDQAINRVTGNGLSPRDILEVPEGAQGPPEVRHRAHVAFRTAWEIIEGLSKVHDRRKAFVYISNGYDFAPFQETRARLDAQRYGRPGDSTGYPDQNPFGRAGNQFSDADLASELAELTRAAHRVNVSFYPIDPRGLIGGPDIDQDVNPVEWQAYVRKAQDSLSVLADLTGGVAIVNSNTLSNGLKRIDNETSDYYVVGYYSTNTDPTRRRRSIELRTTRPGLDVKHRREYVLRPTK
jgi:VWFA-related protein